MGKRSGIMLCYPFEEKRLTKWGYPVITQPKLDGDRCRAIIKNHKVTLLSSEENEFISVPHINQMLSLTFNDIELDGELYNHTMPHEEIHSIVSRTKNLHPDYEKMQFHIFDIVSEHEQWKRLEYLNKLKDTLVYKRVKWKIAMDFDRVMALYDEYLEDDYEGIIIRHPMAEYVRKRSTNIMKFKPKKDDWYNVTGWKEMIDKNGIPKATIGSIICSGDDGTEFSVGSGLTDALRAYWWERRDRLTEEKYLCHVQYQHITPGKGVPRFPILMELVKAEIGG